MTKISTFVPDTEINGKDKLIGTDFNNAQKTKNFKVEDLGTYFNLVNGSRNFEYLFYNHLSISQAPVDGAFYANGNEQDPNNITHFFISKKTSTNKDVSSFFDSITTENPFDLIISQSTDLNTIFFFNISDVEFINGYYKLTVSEIFFPQGKTMAFMASNVVFNLKANSESIHNNLSGLNDGDYKHLTALEKIKFDNIQTGAQVNVLETISSTGDSVQVGSNTGKNINLEVSQATESQLGGGKITTQAIIENESTTNDIDIVTAKKFWQGWAKGLTLTAFKNAVRSVLLDGFSLTYTRITSSDSILSAFGKTQGQIDDLLSTTVSSFSHNVNLGDNTKFDFTASGVIRNPTSGLVTTLINQVFTAQSVTHNANGVTYFGVKEDMTLTQQSTRFTTEQKYSHLCEWTVVYNPSTFVIITFNDFPNTSEQLAQQFHNFMKNSGIRNLGDNQYTNFGTTILNIYKPVGGIVEGVGWGNLDPDNPNEKNMPAISSADTFNIRISTGDYLTGQTVIDPTIYENPLSLGNVLTLPNPNDVTVIRLTFFNSNLTRIQLGQTVYSSVDEAIARTVAKTDPYTTEQNIADNGLTVTYLAIQKNCTAWSQITRYRFFPAPQSGNASSATFVTFNSIYNTITAPQQTITDTKGEMQYDSVRASSSSKIMSWLFGGVEKANVNGNGTFNSQSLTASTPLASNSSKDIISSTDLIEGAFVDTLTSKTTPVDADQIALMDSADSNKLKKASILDLKSIFSSGGSETIPQSSYEDNQFNCAHQIIGSLGGYGVNGGNINNGIASPTIDDFMNFLAFSSGTSANGGYRYLQISTTGGTAIKPQAGATCFGTFCIYSNSSADTLIRIGFGDQSNMPSDHNFGAYLEITGSSAVFKTASTGSRSTTASGTLTYSTAQGSEIPYYFMIHFTTLTSVAFKLVKHDGTVVLNTSLSTNTPPSNARYFASVMGCIQTAGTNRNILGISRFGFGVQKPSFLNSF